MTGKRDRRLRDWKEIAAFFGRDERTVRRWERQRGLPVHRISGGARNLVFAYPEELEGWLRNGGAVVVAEADAETTQPPLPEAADAVASPPVPQPAQAAKPAGLKAFGQTQEMADATKVLAANQGLYNGFLAAGLFWGLFTQSREFMLFFLACVLVAGIYGGLTAARKILFVQALPAAVAIALVLAAG